MEQIYEPKNNTQTNTIVINGEKGDILHENVLKEFAHQF